jgi:hypothetical protein
MTPSVLERLYACMVCGNRQYIQTNHTDTCFAYCRECSWKSFGFDRSGANTMSYGGRAFRRFAIVERTRGESTTEEGDVTFSHYISRLHRFGIWQ